jgi:hypothetical protein
MNVFLRYVFLCLIAFCLSAPHHAHAQSHYINADDQPAEVDNGDDEAQPSHNFVVTSIQKCYAQLSHEDVLDIETNFVKPYEECKKRLAIRLKKKNQLKAGQQKESQPKEMAEKKHKPPKEQDDAAANDQADDQQQSGAEDEKPPTSGGFYRVQKSPLPSDRKPPPDNSTAAEPPPAPPPPQPKITTYSFNR